MQWHWPGRSLWVSVLGEFDLTYSSIMANFIAIIAQLAVGRTPFVSPMVWFCATSRQHITGCGRYLDTCRLFLFVLRLVSAKIAPGDCSAISLCCLLAASWVLHVSIAACKVRLCCRSRCLTLYPLLMPSMVRSLMFFCVHSLNKNCMSELVVVKLRGSHQKFRQAVVLIDEACVTPWIRSCDHRCNS